MTLAGTIAIAGSTSLIKILASERIAHNLDGVPDAGNVGDTYSYLIFGCNYI